MEVVQSVQPQHKIFQTASKITPDEILMKRDFASSFWRDLFVLADKKRASDLHIQQFFGSTRVRMRINGELIIVQECCEDHQTRTTITNRLKQVCQLDISSNDMPQDQAFFINLTKSRYRVALTPTIFGENVVLRIIRDSEIPSLKNSGIRDNTLKELQWALSRKQGFICITGPTGSGKSTTLQAALMAIDRVKNHVITIEDPVERILPDITQEQITKKLTWAKAIKMAMRQDPDVILIGEIRDPESASLALEAAQTGHLVLSTLHTNDVAGIVDRLIGLGVERKLIADNLLFISAQRLVQTLCDCKIYIKEKNSYQRNLEGCEICSERVKGIKGRRPIVEYTLQPNPDSIIHFNKKEFSKKELKTTLADECQYLVKEGIIDSAEVFYEQ